jgi:hypothetical protein
MYEYGLAGAHVNVSRCSKWLMVSLVPRIELVGVPGATQAGMPVIWARSPMRRARIARRMSGVMDGWARLTLIVG